MYYSEELHAKLHFFCARYFNVNIITGSECSKSVVLLPQVTVPQRVIISIPMTYDGCD